MRAIFVDGLMAIMERIGTKMGLAVFMALVAGCTKVGDIADHSGHSAFRVREALKRLQAESLVERVDYRSWQLAEGGHEVINNLWASYVELFAARPEAHKMIASTLAETHKMIASDNGQNGEAHEMIVSSAQNDRFSPPLMNVNEHAWMDDDILQLKCGLQEIGFDRPDQWLQKENVSWELVSDWLMYVNSNGGIRNKAGFVRRQVEAGEKPNLVKARRNHVPMEYEHIIRR